MITEFRESYEVLTPKGEGHAKFAIDYGPESDVLWGVVLKESGQVWWAPNKEVKFKENWSLGRRGGEWKEFKYETTVAVPESPPKPERLIHQLGKAMIGKYRPKNEFLLLIGDQAPQLGGELADSFMGNTDKEGREKLRSGDLRGLELYGIEVRVVPGLSDWTIVPKRLVKEDATALPGTFGPARMAADVPDSIK